jgi:hypothetical protein
MKRSLLMLVPAVLVAAIVTGAVPAARSPFAPTSFRVTNPWFPLKAGSTSVYNGVKDGKRARDVVTVGRGATTIDGVRCAVVQDRLYLDGRLAERTTDWYAQDRVGNVWYYGESTAELDAAGKVRSTEGTWQSGRNAAKPGIFMPAKPHVGQTFRQEFYKGHAEDHFRVLDLQASVRTPAVHSNDALLTEEWTPLEPGVLDHKLYVRGIGTVREESIKGPVERLVLVQFRAARA